MAQLTIKARTGRTHWYYLMKLFLINQTTLYWYKSIFGDRKLFYLRIEGRPLIKHTSVNELIERIENEQD